MIAIGDNAFDSYGGIPSHYGIAKKDDRLACVVIPASVVDIATDAFRSFYILCNNDFTICAPEGSYAEWYAVTEGITYKPSEA